MDNIISEVIERNIKKGDRRKSKIKKKQKKYWAKRQKALKTGKNEF